MKKWFIWIGVMIGFALAANVPAHALSQALDIDALKEEIKQELRNERPWNDDIAAWGIDIHGFVSQGYMNSERYNYILYNSKGGSFQFNEIGINFSKDLTDKLRIGIQFLARDLGDIGNDEPEIDWAYADYRWKDWLGLRVGLLKVPNGFYNESRDIDMLRTCILLPGAVYNESFREIYMGLAGMGIYGNVSLKGAGDLDYQLMMGTQNIDADDSGIVKDMEDDLNRELSMVLPAPVSITTGNFEKTDFDVEEMYIGSLQWRSPWGLRVGGTINFLDFKTSGTYLYNGASTDFDIDVSKCRNYTLSIEYTWEDLILTTEYWNLEYDSTLNWLGVAGAPMVVLPASMDSTIEKEGWYVSAAYRVNDWFECGSYYSVFYPDADDHDGENPLRNYTNDHEAWTRDLALSTRFDINEYWTFKMEGHKIEGKGAMLSSENDNYGNSEDDFYVFIAKMTFSF